ASQREPDLPDVQQADGLVRQSHSPPGAHQRGYARADGNAVAFGASGIGLCRTEHMFFEGDRIDAMREMILADTKEDRKKALAKILPYQRQDFVGMFKELKGHPATIRFLDPPLHEFLPHEETAQADLANKMGVPVEKIKQRVK